MEREGSGNPKLETRNPELLRASAAIRTYPGLSVIFDFFGGLRTPNQTGSRPRHEVAIVSTYMENVPFLN